MKKRFIQCIIHTTSLANAQVGIGNTSPTEALDVSGNIRSRNINTTAGASTDKLVVVMEWEY